MAHLTSLTTLARLLVSLANANASITREGDMLRVTAPPGGLSPELKAELSEHRDQLLALIDAETHAGSQTEATGSHPSVEASPTPSVQSEAPGHALEVAPPAFLPTLDDPLSITRPVHLDSPADRGFLRVY